MFDILNNLNFFFNFKLVSVEEILIIFLFYNFIKILIFSSVFELIWPTQFFNRRHLNKNFKFRSFSEVLLKLKSKNTYNNVFNIFFLNYLFFKK